MAFVVRKDRPIERFELGSVKPFAAAAKAWRQAILRDAGGVEEVAAKGTDAASTLPPQQLLKERLWNPLKESLEGVQTVFVSPDGVVNQIPLAALPGQKADTYLLEEVTLVSVSVPRLLPWLLKTQPKSQDAAAVAAATSGDPSLLIVGNVTYGGSPGASDGTPVAARSAVRGNRAGGLQFAELPGFVTETASVEESFKGRFPNGVSAGLAAS